MRKTKHLIALSGLAVGAASSNAEAWVYDDSQSDVLISGAACRAINGAEEAKVAHLPGGTTVRSGYSEVRLYCPIARRNLHAYDKQLDDRKDVVISGLSILVNRPSANIECRLFGKDAVTGSVQYSTWHQPLTFHNAIWMNIPVDWESYSWGLQCDVGENETIKSIYAPVSYNNN
jgi:hypothetical protein